MLLAFRWILSPIPESSFGPRCGPGNDAYNSRKFAHLLLCTRVILRRFLERTYRHPERHGVPCDKVRAMSTRKAIWGPLLVMFNPAAEDGDHEHRPASANQAVPV